MANTVNEEIKRIRDAKTAIRSSIENKGVTVPADALIDTYASKIDEIQTGGGEPKIYMKDFPELRLARSHYTTIPDNIILDGITDADYMFYEAEGLTEIPSFDSSNCTNMSNMCSYMRAKKVGKLNVSKVWTIYNMFLSNGEVNEIYFTGGMMPDCSVSDDFPCTSANSGTFFYDLPGDYSPVLSRLRPTWRAQPLGNVPLAIRILKDGAWLSGDLNLTINGGKLEYAGKGLYRITEEITKENYQTKSTELQLDGVKIGDVKWDTVEQKILSGDNSSLRKEYIGQAIVDFATQNDGWTYKEDYQAVVSRDVNDNENTTITLPVSGEFEIVYGQASEQNYDFCDAYDSQGLKVWSARGVYTEIGQELTATITTDTSIKFDYHKEGSGTTEPDCFWLKKVSFTNFPPYPEV